MSMGLDSSLYDEEDLIVFPDGLFGFEDKKRFLPVTVEEDERFLYLLSVEDENLSFLVANPFLLNKTYSPDILEEDYMRLEAEDSESLSLYTICVLKERPEDSTVNLKCPIVVNVKSRKAIQVILQSDEYKFRHLLKDFHNKEV